MSAMSGPPLPQPSGFGVGGATPPEGRGGNPAVPPNPSAQRSVPVPLVTLENTRDALRAAQRLVAGHDALASALQLALTPEPSALAKSIDSALRELGAAATGTAPAERPDTHVFKLEQLTATFLREAMLERGWTGAELHVGSAQGETIGRRIVAEYNADVQSNGVIHVIPSGAHNRVTTPTGWTLVGPV